MAFAEMKVDNAEERLEGNADQWSRLMAAGKSGGKRLQVKQSSPPDDLRVASFVRSKWSQSTATSGNGYSHNYYNYYVPNKYPQYSVIASGRVLDQGAVGLCFPDGRRGTDQGRK